MRKKLYPLLVIAALNLTACTEVLEPNIDYGGNTYINDYTALVKAVNDLQKSLEERFDALNTLLKNGMAEIKLAIDENTGAIKILTSTTENGLGDINTSLFNGFTALNTQIKSTGESIIFAINQNGELLRLKIDENGKLLETTLLANNAALIKCINDNSKAIDERIAALNSVIELGLKNIELKIDANTGAITLLDKNLGTSMGELDATLGTINTNLLNGFANLNTQLVNIDKSITGLSGNVAKIETAINKQGDLIVNKLDAQNKLLETTVVGSLDEISASIKSQTTSMEEKIGALNTLIDAGLVKMETTNTNLGTIGGQIKDLNTSMTTVNGNLSAINGSVGNVQSTLDTMGGSITSLTNEMKTGFTTVSNAVEANGTTVITAINKNGETLKTTMAANGDKLDAVSTKLGSLNDSMTDTENGIPAIITAQKALKDAMSSLETTLTENEKNNANAITGKLDDMLKDDGIYMVNGKLYMDYSAWTQLETLGQSSPTYQTFMKTLSQTIPTVKATQYASSKNDIHQHAQYTSTNDPDILVAGNYQTYDNIGTTKKVYQVIRTPSKIHYTVFITTECAYRNIYKYVIKDANGIHGASNSNGWGVGVTVNNIVMDCYSTNGTICTDITLDVYCYSASINESPKV